MSTMDEQHLFTTSIEIEDREQRAAFLDRACGDDANLRKRIEALLEEHERSGEFLSVPALEQIVGAQISKPRASNKLIDPTTDHLEQKSGEVEFLKYLEPATRPGWLGRLAHYEIEEILGRGAFGIVAKAFDDKLHRVVAIKILSPELATTSPPRKRFLREARSAAAISHENIVTIHAVEESPIPYLVMEYVPGKTLQQLMDQNGPLDVTEVLRIGQQIAAGLAAAHASQLIHRDIKPSNILLTGGPNDRVKISDFGLARAVDDATLTSSGVIAGTPMYMAPEQARGETLDHRTDLFSLGSVLYQMVGGRPPFRAPNTIAVLKRVCEDTPRSLRDIIPPVPEWLEAMIFRLMEKDQKDRYQTAQEVSDQLGRYLVDLNLKQHGRVDLEGEVWEGEVWDLEGKVWPAPSQRVGMTDEPVSSGPFTSKESAGTKGKHLVLFQQNRRWVAVATLVLVSVTGLGMTEATGFTNVRGTVIRLFSPEGTVVVEVDDPGVSVSIDGEDMVITGTGAKEIRLRPGEYRLLASKDGKVVRQELVTVTTNGRQVVRVSREPAAGDTGSAIEPKGVSTDPDRRAAEWVLSMGGMLRSAADGVETEVPRNGRLPKGPFHVVALTVNSPTIRDADLAPLKDLTHLRILAIGNFWPNVNLTDATVDFLFASKHLQELNLWGTNITDAGLERLVFRAGALPGLRTLNLGRTKITDAGMVHLASLTKLHDLWLTDAPITGVGLDRLSSLTDLRNLQLEGTKATDADLRFLSGLTHLRRLSLSSTKIDGSGLSHLKDLPELDFISLGYTGVTDASLEHMNGWTRLKGVVLQGTAVTDDGLMHLEGTSGLEWLDVQRTMVTAEGVKKFSTALPRCKISWNGVIEPTWNPTTDQQAFFTYVSGLPAEQQADAVAEKLKEVNPGFDGKARRWIEEGKVVKVQFRTDEVTDIWPVRALTDLTDLDCAGSWPWKGKLSDISPLSGLKLENFKCERTKVSDLSPLRGMPLKVLTCNFSKIADLSPLHGMPLEQYWGHNTGSADLAPLAGMPLTGASVGGNWGITDLSPLKGMKLNKLFCVETNISELSAIAEMPLELLHVNDSHITDLSPIEGMPLKQLSCTLNPISDYAPLQKLPLLEELWLDLPLYDLETEQLLRSLKLKTLQGRPAARFWDERARLLQEIKEFINSTSPLPHNQQIEAVRAKLAELKGTRVSGTEATIKDGVVVDLKNVTGKGVPSLQCVIENDVVVGVVVTDYEPADLTPLQAFSKLQRLEVINHRRSGDDLSFLSNLPLLELTCSGDNAIKNLRTLKGLGTLKKLELNGSHASPELESIKQSLPKCEVILR